MQKDLSYECRCCGRRHAGLPFSYGVDAPAYWREEFADVHQSMLSGEQCIIGGGHFFVRAPIVIPVIDMVPTGTRRSLTGASGCRSALRASAG